MKNNYVFPYWLRHNSILAIIAVATLLLGELLWLHQENKEELHDAESTAAVRPTPQQENTTAPTFIGTSHKEDNTLNQTQDRKPEGAISPVGDQETDRETYRSEKYRYETSYSSEWNLYEDIASLPPSSYAPKEVVNLLTKGPNEEESTIVSIGVHDKPINVSVNDWLLTGYRSMDPEKKVLKDVTELPNGNIQTALERLKQSPYELFTYSQSQQGNVHIREIGAGDGFIFSYTRFISGDDMDYVYAIGIFLKPQYVDTSRYADEFQRIVSSFKTY